MRRSLKYQHRPWLRTWAALTLVWIAASMVVLRNDIPSDPIEWYQPAVLDGRETLIGIVERTAIVLAIPLLFLAMKLLDERRKRRESSRVDRAI